MFVSTLKKYFDNLYAILLIKRGRYSHWDHFVFAIINPYQNHFITSLDLTQIYKHIQVQGTENKFVADVQCKLKKVV